MSHEVLHLLGTARAEGQSVATIVGQLAVGLARRGYRTQAWFMGGDGPLTDYLRAAGATVRHISWGNGLREPGKAWRFLGELRKQNFSLVHQHHGGRSVAWVARRGTGAPIIRHLHGRVCEEKGGAPAMMTVKGADAVIAVSHAVASQVEAPPPQVVYAGLPLPAIGFGSTTGCVVGTACRLVPVKDLRSLLRAIAILRDRVPSIRLEIAGSGPERDSLEREVGALGITGAVEFLGWLPDLAAALMRWDVFAVSSLDEGLPIAAMEAMAAGLPVVATDAGGSAELIQHGQTGWLVPVSDPAALAAKIQALLANPHLRREMGTAARARVAHYFSADRMVDEIEHIYSRLIVQDKHDGTMNHDASVQKHRDHEQKS